LSEERRVRKREKEKRVRKREKREEKREVRVIIYVSMLIFIYVDFVRSYLFLESLKL